MARTSAELQPSEVIAVEELNAIGNNKVPYKGNTGSYAGATLGAAGTVLTSNGATSAPTFEAPSAGDVVGPASAIANNVVLFDGTTGKLIKDSGLSLSGSNTGDQTSIAGITGTKAQFDTAVSDGNIVYTDAIGVSVQAYDADLTTWAGITPGTSVGTALAVAVGSAGAIVTNGGALGTPSSGTVTNLTGTASININGTVGDTTATTGKFTTVETTGNIELGHASDTTISRVSAGKIAVEGVNVGNEGILQNSQSAAYTTVLTDAGKHIYHPSADTTARTWTIDSNANVAYPIGTAITFINDTSAGTLTIAITSDTLVLAGAGTTGSRTLAANGIATAVKMTSTRWIISGTGLT